LARGRTFVGFGFGAIQAGLFLYEAFRSGNFTRLVVAEIVPEVVDAIRRSQGRYSVNIAYSDRIEAQSVGPVEIAHPQADREFLIDRVAEAEEISTALPSVRQYTSPGDSSVHRILAEGLRKKAARGGPRAVVYAAENHNHAAEILEAAVFDEIPEPERQQVRPRVQFLNTVIGKMSGVVSDPDEIRERGLSPTSPAARQAFLVESFNRILISKISLQEAGGPAFERGITVFEEKPDLLPFEEAKLYGHNSTHALAAYIAAVCSVERIADLTRQPGAMAFLEAAFIRESGEALIRRHRGVDPLFTPGGYRAYALDLLERMFNPYLGDTVSRVGRDPARKLEWQDRLIGTLRVALHQGVPAPRYSIGAAAAVAMLDSAVLELTKPAAECLDPLWAKASPDPSEKEKVLTTIGQGIQQLRAWRAANFPDLENFVSR
jgi:mannitol-1-phosphate 5-dehydrogenase